MTLPLLHTVAQLSAALTLGEPPTDPTLIYQETKPDGAVSECRRVVDPKPGWLTVTCSLTMPRVILGRPKPFDSHLQRNGTVR